MKADPGAFVRNLIMAILALVCVVVVIVAHQSVGWVNLGIQFAGLAGLLVLLAIYNRRHR